MKKRYEIPDIVEMAWSDVTVVEAGNGKSASACKTWCR